MYAIQSTCAMSLAHWLSTHVGSPVLGVGTPGMMLDMLAC